jgi:hypothetical protein
LVTVPPGDETIHVFVGEAERELALELYSAFVEKLWWGKKVCGLNIGLPRRYSAVVKELVKAAWMAKAPRRFATAGQSPKK